MAEGVAPASRWQLREVVVDDEEGKGKEQRLVAEFSEGHIFVPQDLFHECQHRRFHGTLCQRVGRRFYFLCFLRGSQGSGTSLTFHFSLSISVYFVNSKLALIYASSFILILFIFVCFAWGFNSKISLIIIPVKIYVSLELKLS